MKSVEDEWERDLVADEDLDLLFIKYDENRISPEELLAKIKQFGFDARRHARVEKK